MGDPHVDNLTSTVIALGGEFWALQRRMNIVEELLQTHGVVTRDMIESFTASDPVEAAWQDQRDRFIKRVYGFLAKPPTDPTTTG